MKKLLGVSWKTTLSGYALAALVGIEPHLPADWSPFVRIICVFLIAVLGKYAADSKQVKIVDAKVEEHMENNVPTIGRNDISRDA